MIENFDKKQVKKIKATIKDIASVLNISPTAISKALHDDSRISTKTKEALKKLRQRYRVSISTVPKLENKPHLLF